jgi:iron complex transport system ATP-binding protein
VNRLRSRFEQFRRLGRPEGKADQGKSSASLLSVQSAEIQAPHLRQFHGPYDLSLDKGERVAILGPSGAGKSTLLKLIAGDLGASKGRVCLSGTLLGNMDRRSLARIRAVLPQGHGVALGMCVSTVVALGRVSRDIDPHLNAIVELALEQAQAWHLRSRRFDTLSGGEQARVQLARVFAQLWDCHHAMVLLDEPLAALDPGLQFDLMDAIHSFAQARQHAVIAVVHDINQALANFDRLWLVRDGHLVADLPVSPDVVEKLSELYGIQLQVVATEAAGFAVIASRLVQHRTEPSKDAA